MTQLTIFPDTFDKIRQSYLQQELDRLTREKEHLVHVIAGFKAGRTKRKKRVSTPVI